MGNKLTGNNIPWILVVLFLILSCIFSKPLYLRPDAYLYYSYARSLYFDNDLFFLNEYNYFNIDSQWYFLTPTGYLGNPHIAGMAILLYPFVILGDWITILANYFGQDIPRNGYSFYYLFFFQLGSRLLFLVGLILYLSLFKTMFRPVSLIISVSVVWLFSPLGFQFMVTPTMSHLCSFFTVMFFIHSWLKSRVDRNMVDWICLGLATGLMTMVRIQNILFLVLLPIEFLLVKKSRRTNFQLKGLILFCVVFLVTILPQLGTWKILQESWISLMEGNLVQFRENNMFLSLFSAYHGLFSWTPILLISFLGFKPALRKDTCVTVGLFWAFILQLILVGFLTNWWADYSFSNRFYVCVLPFFMFLLTAFLDEYQWKKFTLLIALPVIWTVGLYVLVLSGEIDLNHFYPYGELFQKWVRFPYYLGKLLLMVRGFVSFPAMVSTIIAGFILVILLVILERLGHKVESLRVLWIMVTIGGLVILFAQIMGSSPAGQKRIAISRSRLQKYSDRNKYNFDLNAMRKTLQFKILYLIKRKMFQDGIKNSHILLEEYSDDRGYYYLGQCYAAKGKYRDSERFYRLYLNKNPGVIKAKLNLAIVLAESGRKEEAKRLFLEILSIQPNNELVQKNLVILENMD